MLQLTVFCPIIDWLHSHRLTWIYQLYSNQTGPQWMTWDLMSRWRILRSWICFTARHICTNQSRIYSNTPIHWVTFKLIVCQ